MPADPCWYLLFASIPAVAWSALFCFDDQLRLLSYQENPTFTPNTDASGLLTEALARYAPPLRLLYHQREFEDSIRSIPALHQTELLLAPDLSSLPGLEPRLRELFGAVEPDDEPDDEPDFRLPHFAWRFLDENDAASAGWARAGERILHFLYLAKHEHDGKLSSWDLDALEQVTLFGIPLNAHFSAAEIQLTPKIIEMYFTWMTSNRHLPLALGLELTEWLSAHRAEIVAALQDPARANPLSRLVREREAEGIQVRTRADMFDLLSRKLSSEGAESFARELMEVLPPARPNRARLSPREAAKAARAAKPAPPARRPVAAPRPDGSLDIDDLLGDLSTPAPPDEAPKRPGRPKKS